MTRRLLWGAVLGGILLAGSTGSVVSQSPETDPWAAHEEGEIRSELEEVLSSPEFRRLTLKEEVDTGPSWWEKLIDKIFGQESSQRSVPGLGGIRTLLIFVALMAVAFLLLLMVRSIYSRRLGRGPEAAISGRELLAVSIPLVPGELSPREYLSKALALAETGNHKNGIRHLLLGAMSWMERGKLIRHRKGLTNRAYLRAALPPRKDALGVLVRNFERIYFGRRTASPDSFEECLQAFQTSFAEDESIAQMAP